VGEIAGALISEVINKVDVKKVWTDYVLAAPSGEARRGAAISIFHTGSQAQRPFHLLINIYFFELSAAG
jgi:hypothetical protein